MLFAISKVVRNLLCDISRALDGLVYGLISTFYQVFNAVSKVSLYGSSNEKINELTDRIYVILGVAMLFVLAYNIILLIMNPDNANKGEKTVQGLLKNFVISIVLLTLLPTVFDYMTKLQNDIIDSHVIENIILAPVKLKLMDEVTARKKALELLDTINLKDKAEHYPNELSGGQKQRVAIIRTLIMEPDIILFDEPTSALDPEMVGEVLELIKKVADTGKTMIIVSHEMNFVENVANRVLFLEDGKIMFDGKTNEFFSSKNDRIKEFLAKIKK